MRGGMACRGKGARVKYLHDSRPTQVVGNGRVTHPDPGGIKGKFRYRTGEEPRPGLQLKRKDLFNWDESTRERQYGRVADQSESCLRVGSRQRTKGWKVEYKVADGAGANDENTHGKMKIGE